MSTKYLQDENGNYYTDENGNLLAVDVSGEGSGTPLVETTYDELKALRDGGQLVTGQKYRITDYNCTTTQENTNSAMHQFDIIVEALSNNTLSENVSAIQHGGSGGGSPQFNPEVLADSDGTLVEGAIVASYYIFEDTGWGEGTQEDYKSQDQFIAYTYMENNDGVVVPVIYKTDADGAINAPEEFDYPDTEDTFFYDGTMEIDGVVYDKWRKITLADGSELSWDGTGKAWALTNVVVTGGGSVSDPYFANCKLSAWEIKYSLDNDKTRFWWALDGQAIVNLESGFSNGMHLIRQPIFDGCPPEGYSEYQYAWGTQADVEDDDSANFVYSKTEILVNGEKVINSYRNRLETAEVISGTGVIYYMKDEYGNECPYDFKNIQFKRWATDDELANDDKFYSSWEWKDTGDASRWCYTFMANGMSNDTWADASTINPYGFMNDGGPLGCFGNTIKTYISMYSGDEIQNENEGVQWLNNIVMYGQYEDNQTITEEYDYNYLLVPSMNKFGYNCRENTLGSYSCFNTFGNQCVGNKMKGGGQKNVFADDCGYNTLRDGCADNTFGTSCNSNTFGNYCDKNTLGKSSSDNTFGNDCSSNTFGKNCNHNVFGDSCTENSFGNICGSNTLGNNCTYNTFGNNCGYNTFGNSFSSNIVDSDVRFVDITPDNAQYVHIHSGVKGNPVSHKTITVTPNANYTQDVRTANDVTITV